MSACKLGKCVRDIATGLRGKTLDDINPDAIRDAVSLCLFGSTGPSDLIRVLVFDPQKTKTALLPPTDVPSGSWPVVKQSTGATSVTEVISSRNELNGIIAATSGCHNRYMSALRVSTTTQTPNIYGSSVIKSKDGCNANYVLKVGVQLLQ